MSQLGALPYRYAEHFADVTALARFLDGLHPQRQTHYLAVPPGFALPRILHDMARMITTPAANERHGSRCGSFAVTWRRRGACSAARAQRVQNDPDVDPFLEKRTNRRRDEAERREDHRAAAQPEPDPDALERDPQGAPADVHGIGDA